MRCEAARFALVLWPDVIAPTESNRTYPSCITLDGVEDAIRRGAELIGKEWDVIDAGLDVIDPAHSNVRRQADGDDGA